MDNLMQLQDISIRGITARNKRLPGRKKRNASFCSLSLSVSLSLSLTSLFILLVNSLHSNPHPPLPDFSLSRLNVLVVVLCFSSL